MSKKIPPKDNGIKDANIMPLAEEQAEISKTRVVDNHIRLTRSTYSEHKLLQTELLREQVNIEHIAKNELLEEGNFPVARLEGDIYILPIIEEEVEVIRRYILKEEIHICKVQKHEPFEENVTLRRQEINITMDEKDNQSN